MCFDHLVVYCLFDCVNCLIMLCVGVLLQFRGSLLSFDVLCCCALCCIVVLCCVVLFALFSVVLCRV